MYGNCVGGLIVSHQIGGGGRLPNQQVYMATFIQKYRKQSKNCSYSFECPKTQKQANKQKCILKTYMGIQILQAFLARHVFRGTCKSLHRIKQNYDFSETNRSGETKTFRMTGHCPHYLDRLRWGGGMPIATRIRRGVTGK
jgi:hypothetical protein